MSRIVPVLHGFDDRYVAPAAVAFHSMLERADPRDAYHLHVLHSDVTPEHQEALRATVAPFGDRARLEFHDMGGRFAELFERTGIKGHYSKEMFYKLSAASLFPQYPVAIVADVDVVYLDDVAPALDAFAGSDALLAGVRGVDLPDSHWDAYRGRFTEPEIGDLVVGAGFLVMNMERMRQEGTEQVLLRFAAENAHRLRQPEQDVLNLCCRGRIRFLALRYMVCTYLDDLYGDPASRDGDSTYGRAELEEAMRHPVQLHYATDVKPWSDLASPRAEIWWRELAKTPFLRPELERLAAALAPPPSRKGLTLRLPISDRKRLYLEIGREKTGPGRPFRRRR